MRTLDLPPSSSPAAKWVWRPTPQTVTVSYAEQEKVAQEQRTRAIKKAEDRLKVLERMVAKLYEDMVAGTISEDNFQKLLANAQREQQDLKQQVAEAGRERCSSITADSLMLMKSCAGDAADALRSADPTLFPITVTRRG